MPILPPRIPQDIPARYYPRQPYSKCSTTGRGPTVHIRCPEFITRGVNALLDTRSDFNLLSIEVLKDDVLCNNKKVGRVEGIATSTMPIIGTIPLKILGVDVFFHIVPDSPGGYKAILGNDSFTKERVKISFSWNTIITKHRPINLIPTLNPRHSGEQKILALRTGPKIYISINLLHGNYQRFL